jgi:hypothetical protein
MKQATSSNPLRILVASVFVLMVTVNALANILPINGVSTGAVSDSYPNLFAPAGSTFAIWGLIYLWLAAFVVYQWGLIKVQSSISPKQMKTIALYFIISSVANAAWIFAWHYYVMELTVLLMLVILLSLIIVNMILTKTDLTSWDWLFVRLPFSIYFGWITVATIANVTAYLVDLGWDGWGISPPAWTIVALGLGLLISMATTLKNNDIAYGLVILWAYAGILNKHLSVAGFDGRYPEIIIAVAVSMLVIVLAIIVVAKKIAAARASAR